MTPGITPECSARARAWRGDIVHLDVGEPGFPTPAHVAEAGVQALRDGATRYGAPEGIAPLRALLADHLCARGHAATAERVLVSSGAKPMLLCTLLALLEDGDEALVPDPGYPGYQAAVALARGVAIPYPIVGPDGAFMLDVDAIARCITRRTRVLVLNSPHNPTGGVASDAELDALARLALRHDLHVVSDEVYSAITYGAAMPRGIGTRPGMAERTVTVDSFSKTWAMTGWRLGYGLLPATLVPTVRALIRDTTTCTPEFVQRAGVAALAGPQDVVNGMVATYRARRDAMLRALRAIDGIRVAVPAGAFYVFPKLGGRGVEDGASTCDRLLRDHGLACSAGEAYGALGRGHLRLSFAGPAGQLAEGVARLGRYVARTGSTASDTRA